jgi:5-methylcytosine-specific restriction endonuclease McrA
VTESFEEFTEKMARTAGFTVSLDECQCTRTEVRERSIRGGSQQWVRQCLDCGQPVGNPVKAVKDCTFFDNELIEQYREERAQERSLVVEAERQRWWSQYREYMAGPAWADLRARVLKRDGGLCQGCLTVEATDVHHTTYRNFGCEFAFELVSLCRKCHDRIHQPRGIDDGKA